jgi:hypothetical protein
MFRLAEINKDASQQNIKTMLKPVPNRKSVLACCARFSFGKSSSPAAQFLYGSLPTIASAVNRF